AFFGQTLANGSTDAPHATRNVGEFTAHVLLLVANKFLGQTAGLLLLRSDCDIPPRRRLDGRMTRITQLARCLFAGAGVLRKPLRPIGPPASGVFVSLLLPGLGVARHF